MTRLLRKCALLPTFILFTLAFQLTTMFQFEAAALQSCGTTANFSANPVSGGQIVFGSVTLAHGEATVKGFSPSFKTADGFQCTASDKTTAVNAANAVAVSGNSIVIRGTGNDVIAYMCAGS